VALNRVHGEKPERSVEAEAHVQQLRRCSFCRRQEGQYTLNDPSALIEHVLGGPECTAICDDCVLACASALLERAAVRGKPDSRLRRGLVAALAKAPEAPHAQAVEGAGKSEKDQRP